MRKKKEEETVLEQEREDAESLVGQDELPKLPEGPMTTADMGIQGMFDMAHKPEFKALSNLLTKTNLPAMKRAIYMNAISTGYILKKHGMTKTGDALINRAAVDLMAMVAEKGLRVEQFAKPFELELHRERLKQEEKLRL